MKECTFKPKIKKYSKSKSSHKLKETFIVKHNFNLLSRNQFLLDN